MAQMSGETSLAAAVSAKDAEKLQLIEQMISEVDAVQLRVLADILARNAGTEYLRGCGLDDGADRAAFRAKVPVVSYEDVQPYIRRIADGDTSHILSTHPISEFLTSSVTSAGERKLIPLVEDEIDRRQSLYSLLMPVMHKDFRGLDNDNAKGLYFLFVKGETRTPGGLPERTDMTSFYKSDAFNKDDPYRNCTSPTAAILCEDPFQSMYAQMLCGLCQLHDVVRVGAMFASGLLLVIGFLQKYWEKLAQDIEAGEVNLQLVTDVSVREAVAAILRPDPELARLVRDECRRDGKWAGIIKRLWPNTKYLDVTVIGAEYIPKLKKYSGNLPMASTMYASSECYFGINLNPICEPSDVAYTIMPNLGYFEFLPTVDVGATDAAGSLVELARVEDGREYELVITTYTGLNRYRVGDVLRVAGFHKSAPQFKFVGRKDVVLSIDADKTTKFELQRAVERASALLRPHGASVVEYTCQAYTKTIPGYYVVNWELLSTGGSSAGEKLDKETLDGCCLEMEEGLNSVYRQCRAVHRSIGPLEIRVVRPGTFELLKDYDANSGGAASPQKEKRKISGGASVEQYKAPMFVTLPPTVIEQLDSHVVSSHFSRTPPHWTPTMRSC